MRQNIEHLLTQDMTITGQVGPSLDSSDPKDLRATKGEKISVHILPGNGSMSLETERDIVFITLPAIIKDIFSINCTPTTRQTLAMQGFLTALELPDDLRAALEGMID